ncbi:unnamed protein product [Brachionus calyciflorus]|uniref:Uncharacterized protein n=1 Tax=Brachionus calyciflorus TaxID=104777 RepID=A0A813Z876_9BILA|nr:unnamed protein product [Brachionus calyciflorus]
MSKQLTKLIVKAKAKFLNFFSLNNCVETNTTQDESTYLSVTQVDYMVPNKNKVMKRYEATVDLLQNSHEITTNSNDNSAVNISQLPMLFESILPSLLFKNELNINIMRNGFDATTSDYESLQSNLSNILNVLIENEQDQCEELSQMEHDSHGLNSNVLQTTNSFFCCESENDSNENCEPYSAKARQCDNISKTISYYRDISLEGNTSK